MVSGKSEKPSKAKRNKKSLKNPKSQTNFKNIKKQPPNKNKRKEKENIHQINDNKQNKNNTNTNTNNKASPDSASASQHLSFFVNEFQSANGLQLSSLELESIKDTSFVELSKELGQDVNALGKQIKAAFGSSWKEVLCEGQLVEGKIEPGSPAVLIISTSALRVIELLRGVRSLTKECHAAKLFSKHMKVEEQSIFDICTKLGYDEKLLQVVKGTSCAELLICTVPAGSLLMVTLLKDRVNFASGTPSRLKKLIDIEALGLSRLAVVVLDIHTDVKGYSLLTLPQVRDEFWDLYKNYFHQRLLLGHLRICLFGPLPNGNVLRGKRKKVADE